MGKIATGPQKMSRTAHLKGLFRASSSYRPLISLLSGFLVAAILVHIAVIADPSVAGWLWLSSDRPWGVVTSVILHVELSHLTGNIVGLMTVIVVFGGVVQIHPPDERVRWCTVFAIIAPAAAICTNAVEYFVLIGSAIRSWGASGMVYGAAGVFLAAAVRSMPTQAKRIARKRKKSGGKRGFVADITERILSGISIFLVLLFLTIIFFDSDGFFGAGPGVNLFAHEFGFLVGFIAATVFGVIER